MEKEKLPCGRRFEDCVKNEYICKLIEKDK